MHKPQLILHLSDLHFGSYSRFSGHDPLSLGKDTAIDVQSEIKRLKAENKIHRKAGLNLIIVTGDITETAKPAEYDSALQFFQALLGNLALEAKHLVLSPGNHDISWAECIKTEVDSNNYDWSEQELRGEMNKVKFKHFNSFRERLYTPANTMLKHCRGLNGGGWLYEFPELKLSVASLNSCEEDSHRAKDHFGCIHKQQLEFLWKEWRHPRKPFQIRIISLHHNPASNVPDEVNKFNAELKRLFKTGKLTEDILIRYISDTIALEGSDILRHVAAESQVQLILHGHHHAANHAGSWLWNGDKTGMCHILSAGSWGALDIPNARPAVIQLIEIDPLSSPGEGGIRSLLLEHKPYQRSCDRINPGLWSFSGSEQKLPLWADIGLKKDSFHYRQRAKNKVKTIRVSMSVLLRLEYNNKYLLVKNLHRPELFAPFGGVIKYKQDAIAALRNIGFTPEHSLRNQQTIENDLQYDLRGYVARDNLILFQKWFNYQTLRESYDECLLRELSEELNDANVPLEVIESVKKYTFKLIRKVQEGPKVTIWDYDIYRQFEIYEPDYSDAKNGAENLQVTRKLFDLAGSHFYPDLLVVDRSALDRLRADSGEPLAATVDFFFRIHKRSYEPAPFGHIEYSSVAEQRMNKFLEDKESEILKNTHKIGDLVILHAVRKHFSESIVARVNLNSKPHIIKYYPDSNIYVKKEKFAIEMLRDKDIPIPGLLETCENLPAFTILEYLSGKRLSNCAVNEIGLHVSPIIRLISELHKVKFNHYGEIVGEFAPIGNQNELDCYIKRHVNYYRGEIDKYIKSEYRSLNGISKLLEWSDKIISPAKSKQLIVRSAFSDRPCLCHSDIKLTDIIFDNTSGEDKYFLLDFDNVFSFLPEYDLCTFHLSLLEHGAEVDFQKFAKIAASNYNTNIEDALRGITGIYPIVLIRLLGSAVRRDDSSLIVKIDRAMHLQTQENI